MRNFRLSGFFIRCTFLLVLFGPQVVKADYSSLCNTTNLRTTMCAASGSDIGDTGGMCQLDLNIVLEAHCNSVVSLMSRAVPFDGTSTQIEQQIKNVARSSRRIIDVVVPSLEDDLTVYNAINVAVNEFAGAAISAYVIKNSDPLSGKISPNKFSEFMFDVLSVFRDIIKTSIIPDESFAASCKSAVANGNLFRFMANPQTCRTVSQVALDLAYNNLIAVYGIYSNDPSKISKGIIGLTNTAAGIWADTLDLTVDIGLTNNQIKHREIQTVVYEMASYYWPPYIRLDSYPRAQRNSFLSACFQEVENEIDLKPSYYQWITGTHHDYDWDAVTSEMCNKEYNRWADFSKTGKYEALLATASRGDYADYIELFDKWFNSAERSKYFHMWQILSQETESASGPINSRADDYKQAVDAKMIEGSAARAIFGAGNPGTKHLMSNIFDVVNAIDPNNGNEQEFWNCFFSIPAGLTYQEFSDCMIRGLELRKGSASPGVLIYIGHFNGSSDSYEEHAFLNVLYRNSFDPSMVTSQMSEYDMIRVGVRLKDKLDLAMRLYLSTVTAPR